MLWKDYFSFWCSAGLFQKRLCFLIDLQATSVVFCILPFFLLIPSGSLPPAVSGLSCSDRCSSKGKDAYPLFILGLYGVTLHAGEVETLILSGLISSPVEPLLMQVLSVIPCNPPWDEIAGAR